jgi:hypothetical protein
VSICASHKKFRSEESTLKTNNNEQNVMNLLGKEWLKSRASGPFYTDWIFDKFSDIPDKKIEIIDQPNGRPGICKQSGDRCPEKKFVCQHGKGSFLNS